MDKPHFTSWHGSLGWKALVCTPGITLGGVATKYRLQMPPYVRTYHIRYVHKVIATAVFVLFGITLILGLSSQWAVANLGFVILLALRAMVVFIVGVVLYFAKENYLFKWPGPPAGN